MLLKPMQCYRSLLVIYFQIATIFTAPLQTKQQPQPEIIEAQPQVMMHTLQQPIPIETFQSLKTHASQHPRPVDPEIPTLLVKKIPWDQTQSMIKQEFPIIIPLTYPLNMETLLQLMQMREQQSAIHPYGNIDQFQHIVSPENQQLPALMPMTYQHSYEEMQQISMQQQMLALQELQMMQKLNTIHNPVPMSMPQPVLILLPDGSTENTDTNDLFKIANEDISKENELKNDYGHINEDSDSVIVDGPNNVRRGTRKAILLIPNAKFSIGGFISTIPWLPIEINVPDTVTWAWNGISSGIASIISIIGSRLPFRPRQPVNTEANVKMLQQMQVNNYEPVMPIYVMPWDRVIPVHF